MPLLRGLKTLVCHSRGSNPRPPAHEPNALTTRSLRRSRTKQQQQQQQKHLTILCGKNPNASAKSIDSNQPAPTAQDDMSRHFLTVVKFLQVTGPFHPIIHRIVRLTENL